MRRIKVYNNMSEERLLSVIDESESIDNAKIREIKEDFNELRDRFLKPKIKKIKKILMKQKTKIFLNQKQERLKKNLFELEESLSRLKTYYDYDDVEHKRIRNLFNQSSVEVYYKPIKTKSAFNVITSNMKVKEIKTKIYQLKNTFV